MFVYVCLVQVIRNVTRIQVVWIRAHIASDGYQQEHKNTTTTTTTTKIRRVLCYASAFMHIRSVCVLFFPSLVS